MRAGTGSTTVAGEEGSAGDAVLQPGDDKQSRPSRTLPQGPGPERTCTGISRHYSSALVVCAPGDRRHALYCRRPAGMNACMDGVGTSATTTGDRHDPYHITGIRYSTYTSLSRATTSMDRSAIQTRYYRCRIGELVECKVIPSIDDGLARAQQLTPSINLPDAEHVGAVRVSLSVFSACVWPAVLTQTYGRQIR